MTSSGADNTPSYILHLVVVDSRTSKETKVPIQLPIDVFWDISEAIGKMGPDQAGRFAHFIVTVSRAGLITQNLSPFPLPQEQIVIEQVIADLAKVYTAKYETLEDRVLAFTHWYLRQGMKHDVAAQFASAKLGKQYSGDAWRKKVLRWAKPRGLGKVEQRKRTKK